MNGQCFDYGPIYVSDVFTIRPFIKTLIKHFDTAESLSEIR